MPKKLDEWPKDPRDLYGLSHLPLGEIHWFAHEEYAPVSVDDFQTSCHKAARARMQKELTAVEVNSGVRIKATTRRTKSDNELGRGLAVRFDRVDP